MINFMMPGLYSMHQINLYVIDDFHAHKDQYIDDLNFYCAYGNFPHNIWDGGRIQTVKQISIENVESLISKYHDRDVKVRLVCTNPIVEDKHLYNRFMNLVLERLSDQDEIVINSPILEQYIRDTYPDIQLISSTTKRLDSFTDLNNELNNSNYHMVCLDYDLNNHFDELEIIENKDKCEFLVNAICAPKCPIRKDHYRLNGSFNLTYGKPYSMSRECRIKESTFHPSSIKYQSTITREMILDKYVPMGYTNFKLEGRTWSFIDVLLTYAKYFIKPEYEFEFLTRTMNHIFENKMYEN